MSEDTVVWCGNCPDVAMDNVGDKMYVCPICGDVYDPMYDPDTRFDEDDSDDPFNIECPECEGTGRLVLIVGFDDNPDVYENIEQEVICLHCQGTGRRGAN